ncbi:T9SS type B sorting domain-containing protein [Mangrovimonas cancribranchiae]|uniref:T9SS type B sorting domain-containing protein n=1 Tax=Mangrovimonas cancribranchiae TaxID=3080055 RepID=A0AAU6P4Y9_9FLAO
MMKGNTIKKYIILSAFLSIFTQLYAQEPNDCVDAITVCGNGTFMSNASGYGDLEFSDACGSYEHNSIWLRIEIVQDGTLGFDLIPEDPNLAVDYDFWVFGPNRNCANLGSPIRCATTNPEQAGLSNNHTGMNSTATVTQAGPGDNGNGYVRWLDVLAGEYYYIVIDRPHDLAPGADTPFEIQWTGSAMQGDGAFPSPPEANEIGDVKQCSITPDIGVFDLNSLSSSISNDLANETVEYFSSLADATDGINPLAGFYVNTSNPEHVYAKVSSGITDCYAIVEFDLIVTPLPTASLAASDTTICEGDNVTFTITGTPYAAVHYTIDGGATQEVVLDDTGVASFVESPTADMTWQLEDTEVINYDGTVVCSEPLSETETVTVTPTIIPTFTQIDPICEGDTLATLPTTSDNGVTGSWSPAIDNTVTTTYTFTPDAGQCAVTETMEIIVNPIVTPTFTQVDPICEGDTLAALPTMSDNGVTGSWSPAIDNTVTTTYTFTPDAGQCAVTETMEIIVNPIVTPTFTPIDPICEGDTLAALPTTSNNGVTGSWSPAIDNTATTIYTFTPDAGQCAVTETMEIIVNPTVMPIFTPVDPVCEGEALAALPTISNNGITGSWSPAIDNTTTTTYTFTPDAGQCAVTETMEIIVNSGLIPEFTQIDPICEGDALAALPTTSNNGITGVWSPTMDNTTTTTYTFTPDAGQCAVTETMEIVVNPIVTPTFAQVVPICEGDTLAALPMTSDNGVTGSWSPAMDNTTTTTYTFTPDAGQCAVTETMEIVVNPIVIPTFTQVAPICEGDALAALPTTSNNGVTGSWSPAMDNTTTTIYTFTPDTGQCAVTETMEIQVSPIPTIDVTSLTECGTSGNGIYAFDLDAEVANILGSTQNISDFDVTFYEDSAATIEIIQNPYNNTVAYNQTIYVQITNNSSLCSEIFPFELYVEDAAMATMPNPVVVCDDDGLNDGFHEFDLTTLSAEVLNGQNAADYQVTYHETSQGAIDGTDLITNPETFVNSVANNQTIHIRVENVNIPNVCIATTSVDYTVSPVLTPVISSLDGTNTLCVDYLTDAVQNQVTLVSDLQGANYAYTWYLNGTEITGANQDTYVVNTNAPGLYTVSVTEIQNTANCDSDVSQPFEVFQSGQAVLVNVSQSDGLDANPSIIITVEGYGEYWFQLDDGPIVNNGGVFANVSIGEHTVYVYDMKTENPSCGVLTIEDINIVGYPKFFTPNDDSYNDTWNITAFEDQNSAQITIYDRYGKIITRIRPSGPGWDGTYKGEKVPSTDYWFVLTYVDDMSGQQKQFKSHFALKR